MHSGNDLALGSISYYGGLAYYSFRFSLRLFQLLLITLPTTPGTEYDLG